MRRPLVRIGLGLACAALFLWLTLARVDSHAVADALAQAAPASVVAALAAYAVNLMLRAWRWSVILRRVERVRFGAVTMALLVGYGVNFALPARLGELFRAEFCKRRYHLSRVAVLTSIVVERLLDGLTVVACLGIGLLTAGFAIAHSPVLISVLATATTIFGTILLAALLLSGPALARGLARWPAIASQADKVRRGLDIVRTWRFLATTGISIVIWAFDLATIWLLVRAVGVSLSLPGALVLVGIASLGTLLPSGPGFLGTLQFAYALALELFGFDPALGVAAATLAQVCLYLPLAIFAGLTVAFSSASMSWTRYRPTRPQQP